MNSCRCWWVCVGVVGVVCLVVCLVVVVWVLYGSFVGWIYFVIGFVVWVIVCLVRWWVSGFFWGWSVLGVGCLGRDSGGRYGLFLIRSWEVGRSCRCCCRYGYWSGWGVGDVRVYWGIVVGKMVVVGGIGFLWRVLWWGISGWCFGGLLVVIGIVFLCWWWMVRWVLVIERWCSI